MVPRRIDWLHLTVFILALVGILAGLTASLALLVVTAIDVSMGDSANALGIAWATASVASTSLLGLPMAYWTGRKLFRGQAPERSRPAPKWAALALLFPPAIAAGYLASVEGVLPGVLGPSAQVLAAGIPVALLALWVRRLSQPITPTRAWGHFLMGLWTTPILALALEAVLLVGVGAALVAGLASQPGMVDLIMELGMNPGLAPGRIDASLSALLLNPWTLVCVVGFVAVLVPLVEEAIKTLGVVPFLGIRLSPSEAFLGGVLSGLGYALFEALFLPQPGTGWVETMLARIGATLMHAFTAGLTGWALAEMVVRRKPIPALLAYPVAAAIHGVWNASAVAIGLAAIAASVENRQLTDPPYSALAAAAGVLLVLLTVCSIVGIPLIARRLMPRAAPEAPTAELTAS